MQARALTSVSSHPTSTPHSIRIYCAVTIFKKKKKSTGLTVKEQRANKTRMYFLLLLLPNGLCLHLCLQTMNVFGVFCLLVFVFLFLFSVWFTLFIDGNGTKGPFVGLNENPHPCGFNQASSCMRIGSSSSPLHPCAKKSEKGSFLCCCLNDSQQFVLEKNSSTRKTVHFPAVPAYLYEMIDSSLFTLIFCCIFSVKSFPGILELCL